MLAVEYREVFLMQVMFGYTAEEIANMLDSTPGAVTTRLFRARKQLRTILEERSDPKQSHTKEGE